MRRHAIIPPVIGAAALALIILGPSPSLAGPIYTLINDGRSHVVTSGDGAGTNPFDVVPIFVVRDQGCGVPDPESATCATTGVPTQATFGAISDGTRIAFVTVWDSSSVVIDGLELTGPTPGLGTVGAFGSSHVDFLGGSMLGVGLQDQATAYIDVARATGRYGFTVGLSGNAYASVTSTSTTSRSFRSIGLEENARADLTGVIIDSASIDDNAHIDIVDSTMRSISVEGAGATATLQSSRISSTAFLDEGAEILIHGGELLGHAYIRTGSALRIDAVAFRLNGLPIDFGTVDALSGILDVINTNGQSYSFTFDREESATLQLAPEPATALLVLLGLAGLSMRRRLTSHSD